MNMQSWDADYGMLAGKPEPDQVSVRLSHQNGDGSGSTSTHTQTEVELLGDICHRHSGLYSVLGFVATSNANGSVLLYE